MKAGCGFIKALGMVALTSACGTVEFTPGVPKSRTADQTGVPQPTQGTPDTSLALSWNFDCAPSGDQAGVTAPTVRGSGVHEVPRPAPGNTVKLSMTGQVCKPDERERDIVFVIDVSGSMGKDGKSPGNDPRKGGTCGRLDAVENLIAKLSTKSGKSQFSLVTFETDVHDQSNKFVTSLADLQTDIGKGDLNQVICQGYGWTNYSSGLNAAAKLFKSTTARKMSKKEIYFISDGAPGLGTGNPDDDEGVVGVKEAEQLRNEGVMIATVMLNGDDEGYAKLRAIASVAPDGTSLYADVNGSKALAESLLAYVEIKLGGAVLRYRSVGGREWMKIDLGDTLKEYTFLLPVLEITPEKSPQGVEMLLDSWDTRGTHSTTQGKITWK